MKLEIPPCFEYLEARAAIAMIELLIDALIELHANMCRTYEINPTDEIPF